MADDQGHAQGRAAAAVADAAVGVVKLMGRRHQLLSFGLLVGGIFGLIDLWRHRFPRTWAVTLAVLLIALVASILGPAYRLWMKLAEVLAWINTRILLGVVFYLVVTPIGLIMRLLGRDPGARRR